MLVRGLIVAIVGTSISAGTTGCADESTVIIPVYDACFTVDECVETATLCEELAVDFAGFTYSNSICTLTCGSQGSVSPDCPIAWVGRLGSCYPSSLAGGVDDTLICFDPCDLDEDCQSGFRCLGPEGLCPGGFESCALDERDAICVPGPH